MKKKISSIKSLIIPSKSFNIFILLLLVIGITCGAIYYNLLTNPDLEEVNNLISDYATNIKNNNYNYVQALIYSLGNNIFYMLVIFILGISIIGIPLIIVLIFTKGLTVGFTISTLLNVYKYKGSLYSFIYIFPKELLSFASYIIIGYYSINFSIKIFKQIFTKKEQNLKKEAKKYLIALIISIIIGILCSFLDAYLYPNIYKLLLNILK